MERLQKVIAQAGITSRRKAEQLIIDGRVRVNGKTVTELGVKVSGRDRIAVDGVPIDREEPVYFFFYKPAGVISSVTDDRNRKVVTDFFPHVSQRIFPVGRLDYDTSGALLMTNDGLLANRLMHPRFGIDKTYIAKIDGVPTKDVLEKLGSGVQLDDGPTAKAKVQLLSCDRKKGHAAVELTIHEGRNRQVRRMFKALGFNVTKLKRVGYGFLSLDGLHPGESRMLKPHEVKALYQLAGRADKPDIHK